PPGSKPAAMGPPWTILGAGAVLTVLTWNRWVDPQVDFGRELYLAWRISEGDVLYRDLASFSGPLSPTVNGALFRILGPGIHPLLVFNMVLLVAITTLSYRLLAREIGRWPAALACTAFLALCAFGHSSGYGIFNFVAPYSHELTHGTLLGLAGLALLGRAERSRGLRPLLGVGLCAGLSLLLKPEIALAVVGSLGTGVVLLSVFGTGRVPWLGAAWTFAAGLMAAPLGYLSVGLLEGRGFDWTGLVWPWAAALNSDVRASPFYAVTLGLDTPLLHLGTMLGWALVWALLTGGAAWATRRLPRRARGERFTGLAWFGLVTPVAAGAIVLGYWPSAFAPVAPLLAVLLVKASSASAGTSSPSSSWRIWGSRPESGDTASSSRRRHS
ncbi:MAG: hypothetical protein P8188_13460, partial [Gemmatimonadota bacterium]